MSPGTPRVGTVLAFDFGLARIGVAVGETETGNAHPLTAIAEEVNAVRFAAIEALLAEWKPASLVVGLPTHLDGSEHAMTARCRRFANQLHGRYGLPVALGVLYLEAARRCKLNVAGVDFPGHFLLRVPGADHLLDPCGGRRLYPNDCRELLARPDTAQVVIDLYLMAVLANKSYNYSFGDVLSGGAAIKDFVDENISWETTRTYNLGLDFEAFDHRLLFSVDLYKKRTEGILRDVKIPAQIGNLNGPKQNIGVVANDGVELNLQWRSAVKNFHYSLGGNFCYNKNIVVESPLACAPRERG